MNKTILDVTPELRAELDRVRREHDEQSEKVSAVITLLQDEYTEGGMAFRTLCQRMARAIETMPKAPGFKRSSMLGEAVETALKVQSKKKGRGRSRTPVRLLNAAANMVKMAQRDGLKITRESGQAFDQVAELLRRAGYASATTAAVERWFYARNTQKSKIKD